ncbi:MAG: hypothetical protein GY765_33815 [bacterium]|nr:hypothetical protein [bacterium]
MTYKKKNDLKTVLKTALLLSLMVFALKWNIAMDNKNMEKNTIPFYHKLDTMNGFEVNAKTAEIAKPDNGYALKLEGMILFPDQKFRDARIEVEVFAQQPCYPGIIFRLADKENYELAYAVPHVTNQPDALQYDPVFNGSNTWQLYTGDAYQKAAAIPTGKWFSLIIDITDRQAAISIGGQPPLVVEQLAHTTQPGAIGLWTFKPAYFRNLKITPHGEGNLPKEKPVDAPLHAITAWKPGDGGVLKCEPNGILNLNRYMKLSKDAVTLSRQFHLPSASKVVMGVGFSDELALYVDGKQIFQGSHIFKGFQDIPARGHVTAGHKRFELSLPAGKHEIRAELKASEPFGWGLLVTLSGENLHLQALNPKK